MATWQVKCTGEYSKAAMQRTIIELGGFWQGGWFISSDRHPAYLCRRLVVNFLGGPFYVRLDVAFNRQHDESRCRSRPAEANMPRSGS